jgi:hypothetical protein
MAANYGRDSMTTQQVLDGWYQRVVVTQRAHYMSANHYDHGRYAIGIPTIMLSTFVGTAVFATLQKSAEPWLQICIGFASVVAAVLASLQLFLGYAERAERHRVAGAKYGALGRELEVLRTSPALHPSEVIDGIRKRLDAVALESPNNPIAVYNRAGQVAQK